MNEIIVSFLVISGTGFILLAALGILTMPDLFMRMSSTTKAATLGIALTLLATTFYFRDFAITSRVLAAIIFVLLTTPTAAHMIGRAAYFNKVPLWDKTLVDELRGLYDDDSDDDDVDSMDD